MTDREFVEQHWLRGTFLFLGGGEQFMVTNVGHPGSWTAAAQFTRDRLEEIRQLRMEIDYVDYKLIDAHRILFETTDGNVVRVACTVIHRWSRIKARLEAQLAELKKGMKVAE